MAALDVAHGHPVAHLHRPRDHLRRDKLHPVDVGTESLVPDDQRQRDRIQAKDQRPFLRDDMEQRVEPVSVHRRQHRFMDRGGGTRMAAGEGDKVLIGLFGRAEPLAQLRHSAFLEWNNPSHAMKLRPERVNIQWLR